MFWSLQNLKQNRHNLIKFGCWVHGDYLGRRYIGFEKVGAMLA